MQEPDEAGSDAEASDEDEDAEAKAERLGRRLAQNEILQPSTSGRQAAEDRVRAAVSEGRGARSKRKGRSSEAAATELDQEGDGRFCATEGPVAVQANGQVGQKQKGLRVGSKRDQAGSDMEAAAASGVNIGSRDVLAAVARQQREHLMNSQPGAAPVDVSMSQRAPFLCFIIGAASLHFVEISTVNVAHFTAAQGRLTDRSASLENTIACSRLNQNDWVSRCQKWRRCDGQESGQGQGERRAKARQGSSG